MSRNSGKPRLVAFKVEEELAEFLDALPNKSEFIRRAILAQFGMTCPLCAGSGVVPRGIGEHFKPALDEHREVTCRACHRAESIPGDPAAVPAADRRRWEQFFRGGGFYCRRCHADAPACDDCGWHLPNELLVEHLRKEHRG